MKSILTAVATATVLFATAAAQASSLLFSQTIATVSPSGNMNFFENDFDETFDFSSVSYDSIELFELSLVASKARNEAVCSNARGRGACRLDFFEDWSLRVEGSVSGVADDFFEAISDGTNAYTITATSDSGLIDVFANAVASGRLTLRLADQSGRNDKNPRITVSGISLNVYGTAPAPVPLPASLPLLLAGLAGISALRMARKPKR